MKYSILIQWSEEDNCYLASLPEWGEFARTHGDTYEAALKNAKDVLEDLVFAYNKIDKPLPTPQIAISGLTNS
jgi:predicted RNase H-like HicB family nuclease